MATSTTITPTELVFWPQTKREYLNFANIIVLIAFFVVTLVQFGLLGGFGTAAFDTDEVIAHRDTDKTAATAAVEYNASAPADWVVNGTNTVSKHADKLAIYNNIFKTASTALTEVTWAQYSDALEYSLQVCSPIMRLYSYAVSVLSWILVSLLAVAGISAAVFNAYRNDNAGKLLQIN